MVNLYTGNLLQPNVRPSCSQCRKDHAMLCHADLVSKNEIFIHHHAPVVLAHVRRYIHPSIYSIKAAKAAKRAADPPAILEAAPVNSGEAGEVEEGTMGAPVVEDAAEGTTVVLWWAEALG